MARHALGWNKEQRCGGALCARFMCELAVKIQFVLATKVGEHAIMHRRKSAKTSRHETYIELNYYSLRITMVPFVEARSGSKEPLRREVGHSTSAARLPRAIWRGSIRKMNKTSRFFSSGLCHPLAIRGMACSSREPKKLWH